MAIGSGLGAAFGIVDESVYGTLPGSPTWRWHDTKDKLPDLKMVKNVAQGDGLASGRLLPPVTRRVITTQAGAISSLPTEVLNNKMGLILKHVFGGTVTPTQQAATTAYLQTHTLVDNSGQKFSAQAQVPQTDGTVKAFTGQGGKITSAEFSCEVDGLLMLDMAADFQKVLDTASAGTPSYATAQWPFHFGLMNVKLGATYGSESAVSGVRKASVKIDRGQDTGMFYAGAAGLKASPVMNGRPAVTGSLDVDFVDKTVFADRFAADTTTALVLEWVGTTAIASTYYPAFRLKMPAVKFDDGTPTVDSFGVVTTTFPFTVLDDQTNAVLTCEYMSTDTTL
jgi:hypothetical protein